MKLKCFTQSIVILAFIGCGQHSTVTESTYSIIDDAELDVDFGTVLTSSPLSKEVVVRNTFNESIEIDRFSSTCGCTVGMSDHKVVQPGAEFKVTISLEPGNYARRIRKRVGLFLKGQPLPFKLFIVTAQVLSPIELSSPTIDWAIDDSEEKLVRVINNTDDRWQTLEISAPAWLSTETIDSETGTSWDIRLTIDRGKLPDEGAVHTALVKVRPAGETMEDSIRVSVKVRTPLEAIPARMVLHRDTGLLRQLVVRGNFNETASLTCTLKPTALADFLEVRCSTATDSARVFEIVGSTKGAERVLSESNCELEFRCGAESCSTKLIYQDEVPGVVE